MKSLRQRLKKHETSSSATDWNKYDERLLKAVENGDVDKVTNTLKKGAVATKLDADGRSSLHLAASNGLINSLNVFLAHGVNLRTADAAGKTALHLSSRGGHSACVQRLLQCKSPVDITDLHGRTALQEAAYAGHNTIIKMLCGSSAAVNAVDKDGHSALMMAAQMGHPRACQQLLNCGASANLQDSQNKTALILACEHGCHEAVEVLLKHKADVTTVDLHGHNSCHYARLTGDKALIIMMKQAWDAASKEASKTGSKIQQQRSVNNETRMHVRKVSVQAPAKGPPSVVSSPSTVPPQQHTKEYESHLENGKENNLQSYHLDCAQVRHHAPRSAAPASSKAKEVLAGEVDLLKKELWEMRRRYDAAQEELHRLDAALVLRTRDYEGLRRSSERALQQAHSHAWELEEALGEVQHRMAGSEARVRQMQAHLVNLRENLVEELREQLHEAKTELHRVQEELGQSKREAEEQEKRNNMLQKEVHKLTEELLKKEDTNALQARLTGQEAQRAEMACKEIQTPSEWKPGSPKSTMTDLTSETLQREMDKKNYISPEEHESVRSSLSTALQQAQNQAQEALVGHEKITEDNQSLIRELQEQRTELDTLQEALQARFVPVAMLDIKETEVAQLRLALEQMEKSKEREEKGKKTSSTEVQKQSQPEQTSQNIRDTQTGETPEKSTTTSVNFKEARVLLNNADEENKDLEVIVEAEGQRETQNSSSAPSSVHSLVHSDSAILQAHINSLQQQLENSERHYRQVLGVYRTRLLSAAQGYMDEEARLALLQIAQMRQECVC